MNKRIWIPIGGILGIAILAAVIYLSILLIGNRVGLASARPSYEEILPTQWPARPSDLQGLAGEVKDNRIFVAPAFKRKDAQQEYPQVEVVVTNDTEIYRDETDRQHPTVVNGKFLWTIRPFTLGEIKAGYVLNVWGNRRGDRLIADTIIVYVIPAEEITNP